ncbi:hypothetical protein EVG20_g8286 [Dentipellis fragilis]|uniref:Methyltransferase domain-containing protein n=1 Tax=Dentipellis fragilis TaxID=205917 RepID=A0A4Y9Y6W1_9AGAM|nr:hypothetical protein EVG20_g8286 [Dentipellis fragilis]
MPSSAESDANYVLPDSDQEKARLASQHFMMKKVMGRPSPIPEAVDVDKISDILDIAAGTCVWTLEVANLLEVKPRIHPAGSDSGQK